MRALSAVDFVDSYIEAWNHHDPRWIADHLTRDGVYCDIPTHQQHPRHELVPYLANIFDLDRSRYELEGEIVTGRNSIAFQYQVRSDAETPVWFGAEFVTLHGEHAVYIADYYKEPIRDSKREETRGQKYAKSGLNPELLEVYKQALNDLMMLEHTYLNSDLTLPKLAKLMQCSLNHLSQVINAGFGMSFFDYLNHHRIEAAKKLLSQHDSSRGAILSIAFEVGFNSNSAFYTAFKKTCGQTPAQYRRSQQIET